MPSYPKNYPFYSWMPKPLGIIILLFFFLPILTVGGVYSVNSTEMMSGLGIISEHIQFANFVTSIGMAAFAPFLYQLVCVRREKMMCIVGFAFMYIFSYICAKTDSVFLLALCSLLTGFLRMVLMMVNLFTLIWYAGGMEATRNITPGLEPKDTAGWNKLDIERCVSQPAVYLFFMILGQSGTALTAWLSFEYEWKYVYCFMMGILLISILLLFITMPNYKFPGRFPINFRKFGNVTAFCISLTCLTYVLVYGKVLDWYDDESIRWATAVSILFAGIFLYMDVTRRSPYVLLDAFKLRTIRMGALLYLLLMVINSSAMFVNVFAGVGMHIDNLQNAALGNWCMVGYAIGAVLAMAGQKHEQGAQDFKANALGTITDVFVPGSVVKGATLTAGWRSGAIYGNQVLTDQPINIAGSAPITSWFTDQGSRAITATQALEYSSNTYMVQIAIKLLGQQYVPGMALSTDNMDKAMTTLRDTYADFGMGVSTGLDLPGESEGYISKNYNVANVLTEAFGQYDSYTTIQLAQYVASIANGGKRVQPHLFMESFTYPSLDLTGSSNAVTKFTGRSLRTETTTA